MQRSSVNLSDVATRAGVSKSTVSRVLNNKLGHNFCVSDELRRKIHKIARELNYRPNLIAQSLTKQRTAMVHIFGGAHALSDLGNIFQTVVNTVTEEIYKAAEDFDVTVDMSPHDADTNELPPWRINGAIILSRCSRATLEELEQSSTPYAVVNGPCGPNGSSVVPDDVQGMEVAVRYLVKLGHKRIAYAGPCSKHIAGHSSIADRRQTYLKEMSHLGLSAIEERTGLIDSPRDFLESAVTKHEATAIIAYGHMEGLNLMQAAHSLGIAVPEQLSVICFCDEYANSVMSPGLTFIDLRSQEMGLVAAQLLLGAINDSNIMKPARVIVKERLIIRQSTAPASNQGIALECPEKVEAEIRT